MLKKAAAVGLLFLNFCPALAEDYNGGAIPCLSSCLIGPRVGLELNEGKPIEINEVLNLFIPCIIPYSAFDKNGIKGCLYSCCVGPRVAVPLPGSLPGSL